MLIVKINKINDLSHLDKNFFEKTSVLTKQKERF